MRGFPKHEIHELGSNVVRRFRPNEAIARLGEQEEAWARRSIVDVLGIEGLVLRPNEAGILFEMGADISVGREPSREGTDEVQGGQDADREALLIDDDGPVMTGVTEQLGGVTQAGMCPNHDDRRRHALAHGVTSTCQVIAKGEHPDGLSFVIEDRRSREAQKEQIAKDAIRRFRRADSEELGRHDVLDSELLRSLVMAHDGRLGAFHFRPM